MPYEPYPQPNDERVDRYALIAEPAYDYLHLYWSLFMVTLYLCVLINAFLVYTILSNSKLRKNSFNLFLLGLCIPDGLFSWLCAIQCMLNLINGSWNGGNFMCDYQGFYITFCLCCSTWTAMAISFQMKKMTEKIVSMQVYTPIAPTKVAKILGLVVMFAGIMAFSTQLGWMTDGALPLRNGAYHGMFCVPQEYDTASTLMLWFFYINLAIFLPGVLIAYHYGWCFHKLIKMEMKNKGLDYKSAAKSIMSPGTKNKVAILVKSFVKFFLVYVTMWGIGLIGLWIISTISWMVFVGGMSGHLHGMVSPLIYMTKTDIKKVLLDKYKCLRSGRRGERGRV